MRVDSFHSDPLKSSVTAGCESDTEHAHRPPVCLFRINYIYIRQWFKATALKLFMNKNI